MNIDTVLGNEAKPTGTQLKAGLAVLMAVSETIREAGEVPSGIIYATLADRLTLEGYNKMLGILKGAGLIKVGSNHLIKWIGPEVKA